MNIRKLQPTERLYLQYKPDDEALGYLTQLQRLAMGANPQAKPVSPDRLHLTLIHFGIVTEVYEEIRARQRGLSWQRYVSAIGRFVMDSQAPLPERTTVSAQGTSMYGGRKSVLALKVAANQELVSSHAHCLAVLEEFLTECGITYPLAFMQSSRNFSHAAHFNPHITLLRSASQTVGLPEPGSLLRLSYLPVDG